MNKLLFIIVVMHVNMPDGIPNQQIQERSTMSGCNTARLVLNLSLITDLPKWEAENAGHNYQIKTGTIEVDLSSIPQAKRSMWLLRNNKLIKFNESSTALSCMHAIPNIAGYNLGTVKSSMTLAQISEVLTARGTPLIDSCEQFVELSFDAANKIVIKTAAGSFDSKKHYYSMALFMALGRTSTRGNATPFTFHKASYQNKPVIVIEVAGATKSYYDFAQYPT